MILRIFGTMRTFHNFILYIDPGTGSLLLQIVVGGLIASAMFFKRIWYSIFSVFKRKGDPEKDEE